MNGRLLLAKIFFMFSDQQIHLYFIQIISILHFLKNTYIIALVLICIEYKCMYHNALGKRI